MKQETAHDIDQQAADWAAKVDRGLSAKEQSDLDAWLADDVRRIGAYGRMRAIALQAERVAALGPVHSPSDFVWTPSPRFSRRNVLVAGGTIAASLAGISLTGWMWLMRGRFFTRKGELRQLVLKDGSVVTLNTDSDVMVNLSKHRREVRLTSGEAMFEVAGDKTRPFVVIAGSTEARVVGTSFVVRALPGKAVQILVREGIVDVLRVDQPAYPSHRLTANMRAVSAAQAPSGFSALVAVTSMPEDGMQRALAWRDGRVAFEGETLEQAAVEFARYSDTKIVVDDPGLAKEEIAGLYQTNDPVGFARIAAASLRAEVKITDGEVHIRKAMS